MSSVHYQCSKCQQSTARNSLDILNEEGWKRHLRCQKHDFTCSWHDCHNYIYQKATTKDYCKTCEK